jgi:D-glycero-alpha-D-manno-heptose-7-phosphate kinase
MRKDMLIRAKAPLRLSFAGGGTDVPPFPEREGGCALSATINRYACGTFRPRTDGQICIDSLDYGLSVRYRLDQELTYDGKLDLVKAAINGLGMNGLGMSGFDLYLQSDVPPGSGLGASSAMMVSLVGLLKEAKGLPLTDYEIADLAYVLEREKLGIQGGLQDQYAATFGGFAFMTFGDKQVVVNSLKISRDIVNELEHNLLLCYTGSNRLSAKIIEDQTRRYESGYSENIEALRQLKVLATDLKDALLSRRLNDFGYLLHEAWVQKKRMSAKISNVHIDDLYEAARAEGALGGKIIGAGGGGYMLLYCGFPEKHRVARRMSELGCTIMDFAFESNGLQTWRLNGN